VTYLLDTNVLAHYLRQNEFAKGIDQTYQPFVSPNTSVISVVTVGEIKALSLKRGWGRKKNQCLETLIDSLYSADIHVKTIINKYAKIDAFSQSKLKDVPLNTSARNMGKNDIWIAATAIVLNVTLLTTDDDFNHLKDKFIKLEKIELIVK